jgi:hypothetical protein
MISVVTKSYFLTHKTPYYPKLWFATASFKTMKYTITSHQPVIYKHLKINEVQVILTKSSCARMSVFEKYDVSPKSVFPAIGVTFSASCYSYSVTRNGHHLLTYSMEQSPS